MRWMMVGLSLRRRVCTAAMIAMLLMATTGAMAQEVVAHRGASAEAPENTLAAFELAWEQEADAIEGDFYLTRDGQIVCMHDRTTQRTADRDLVVADSTLAELQALDVGSWKGEQWAEQRPPTLAQVMATVPAGKRIFIEIKCGVEIMNALEAAVAKAELADEQIVIISFDADVIAAVRERLPRLEANWLVSYEEDEQTGDWSPTMQQVVSTLERIEATGLSTQANEAVIDEAAVRQLRERGLGFHTWTVNDAAVAQRFADLGVDTITTDRPSYIREVLKQATD